VRLRLLHLLVVTGLIANILAAMTQVAAQVEVELAYDDGTFEGAKGPSGQCGVRFSLPPGWTSAEVVAVKYYIHSLKHGPPADFEVHIYDTDGMTDLITPFTVRYNCTGVAEHIVAFTCHG